MNKKAFTLVELAIVLVIVGVVTAGAVKMINGSLNNSRHSSSKNSLDTALKELAAFSARAQRIPAGDSLGDAVANTRDSYGTQLSYIPDAGLVAPPVSGSVSSICSLETTALTLRVCADADCNTVTNTVNNVAFFLSSAGQDETFQFTNAGGTISVLPGNDDLTAWMTLDTLKTFAGCKGSGLTINQDRLPPIAHGSVYSFNLTPKGGISPYEWCVESDDEQNAQALTYSTTPSNKFITDMDACAGTSFVTADNISLQSVGNMVVADDSPSTARIRVRLRDANQRTVTKQYTVPVIKQYELALVAKDAEEEEEEEEDQQEEEEDDEVITGSGGFGGFFSTSNYITTATADTVNFHGTSVLNKRWGRRSSMYNQAACVWLNCNIPGSSSNLCPSFTKSKMAVYFEYTPSNFGTFDYWWSTYATAYGFTFAVVKSYKPVWTYNTTTKKAVITGNVTTVTDCGESISGLGYAKRNNTAGTMFGNSFAVEFDRWQTNEDIYDKNDPYKNLSNYGHIAIVSNATTNQTYRVSGTWTSYTVTQGHAYNKHNGNSYSYSKSFASSYNDACTTTANSGGCYMDANVVPNNVKSSVRIEAISGCNSNGSTCNGASGNNYICVYAWKSTTSSLSADATTAMKDTSKFYKFPGTTIPAAMSNPLVKDCFPDTAGNYTLDSVRYGFTIGSGNSDQASSTSIPDYSLKLENFKHNFLAY